MGTPAGLRDARATAPRDAAAGQYYDVAVIGGGVVGHGIAWEAQRSGRTVALIDDAPGTGASFAAAGMLAPVSELHYQEEDLLELMLESSRLWPDFAARLQTGAAEASDGAGTSASGTGYLTTPTLAVGADAADRRALADLRSVQQACGLSVEPLTVREARGREPLLSPGISCAFDIPADHQVDPRLLLARIAVLLAADRGSRSVQRRAAGLLWQDGRVAGVSLADGAEVRAGETIVANGLGAAGLGGLPRGLSLPLRPVHGDILRLRVPPRLRPLLGSTVRGLVRGVPVYIVPRQDGTVVIGATQREDTLGEPAASGAGAVSAGGVYQLLRDAQQLLPAVAELELLEAAARARPATPDNAPLLGRVADLAAGRTGDVGGVIVATGFFRHGILLTPAAAQICRQLLDGTEDPRWSRFRPDRFSAAVPDAGPQTPPRPPGLKNPRPQIPGPPSPEYPEPAHPPRAQQGNTMKINLNGSAHTVPDGASVSTLVSQITGRTLAPNGQATDGRKLGVAVARNAGVVPRSQWHGTALADGDDVELVTAVQGG